MSKVVERALSAVRESQFNFMDDTGSFEVRNAFIFWTNFRGEANKFGNAARTFNLAINPDMAKILAKNGWRIREAKYNEGQSDEDILYFVSIKINTNSNFPPVISLYTNFRGKKSKRQLTDEAIGELDRVDIQSADCQINAYESPLFPGKITGYLKKLNVIQEPDVEFGGKYDDWMDEEHDCMAPETPVN